MKKQVQESDIWILIETKDFSQLSEEERVSVLNFLSQQEYQNLRKISLYAKKQMPQEVNDLKLRPKMAKDIFEQGKQKRKSLLKRLALYQVPAWQAAAAVVFMACTFYAWGNSTSTLQQNPHPYVNTNDSLLGISLAEDSSLSRFMIESL